VIRTAALLLAALPLLAAPQDPKPKGLEGVGLNKADVTNAVNRAVDWFKARLAEAELGSRDDLVASLAILHADGAKRHRLLGERIAAFLKTQEVPSMQVYDLGVLAMICESLGDPRHIPLLKRCVRRLVELQGEDGSWGYGQIETPDERVADPKVDAPPPVPRPKSKRVTITGGRPIVDAPKPAPSAALKRTTPWDKGEAGGDRSASQYAILGLFSGHRVGITIDEEVWTRARKFYADGQGEDGGWSYKKDDGAASYGSMTCAGVASVAICSFALGDRDWKDHAAVKKGLAWLAKNFSVEKHPPDHPEWHFYYLYGLERVGRILDVEFIGDHEWFPSGAKMLLSMQKEDGSWDSENNEVLATGFALLFLTRATASLKVPEPVVRKPGSGVLTTAAWSGGGGGGGDIFHVILDCSGSMGAKMGDKRKFVIAQDAVCAMVEGLSDTAWVGLRAYGHTYGVDDSRADEDSDLLIPIGKLDRRAYVERVRKLAYNGRTPLAYSLRQTAKDLKKVGGKITVVLLTDGAESTPGANPEEAAKKLLAEFPNVTLHVVAFDINDDPSKKQCEAIAAAGRGKCYPAGSAAELLEGMKAAVVVKTIAYDLFDKDGAKKLAGSFGDRHELPEGKYRIAFTALGEAIDEELWINTGVTTTVTLDLTTK